MQTKPIKLGIFGFGCVGQGLWKVLGSTRGIKAEIKKICIKHPEKIRPLDQHFFTTDRNEILNDPDIDVVVELINDPIAAYEIVSTALKSGKAVVSASKKMIADNIEELYKLQMTHNVPFLYEGACCASIPIIRNLEEYYDNDLLNSVEGIFNGSSNYIFSKIFNENKSFDEALKEAQDLGFAETDPTLDIGGFDSKHKLCIILLHSFGLFVNPNSVFNYGIQNLNEHDITYAREKGYKIKLIAKCQKIGDDIIAYCLPKFVNGNSNFTTIENEYNAVNVVSVFSDSQLFVGKGAGDKPTGSAVLSDISALTYNYKYEYKKTHQNFDHKLSSDLKIKIYCRYNDLGSIDLSQFDSIDQKFESSSYNYLIGDINLSKLAKQDWLDNKSCNIVVV